MSTNREYWAERKREERKRMRKAGFVLKQLWAHPEDWPAIEQKASRMKTDRMK